MSLTTRDTILIGFFAALMVVGAYLKLPNPMNPAVPITFQVFFAIYAGIFLGAYKGALSQLIYMLMGLIGIPVFSGGGGFQYVLSPTFGYIIGFILGTLVVGLIVGSARSRFGWRVMFGGLAGFVVIYIVGNAYFWMIMNQVYAKGLTLAVANVMMAPYMVKDAVLVVIAVMTSMAVLPRVKKAGYI